MINLFTAIIEAVRSFDQKFMAAYNAWKAEEKQIMQNYAGVMLADKINESKTAFLATVDSARSEALTVIEKCFADIESKIQETILALDPDLMQLASIVHMVGKNISAAEAKVFMKKASANYLASVAMAAALEGNGFKTEIIRYEDIAERLENLKSMVIRAVNAQQPESYNAKCIYADNNALVKFETEVLNPFVNR